MKIIIRRVRPKDIDSVVKLIHAISARDYNNSKREMWNIFRKSSYKIYRFVDSYVIELNKEIIGYGGIWSAKYDPKRFSMLDWFVIDKYHREMGLGHQLMKFLFKRAQARKIRYIYVETWPENKNAVKFYKNLGFKQICKIPEYYDDETDLIILLKDLQK